MGRLLQHGLCEISGYIPNTITACGLCLRIKKALILCPMSGSVFQFIKADQFFPKYCPSIKSYKHKIRGKNGRGNPVEFSTEERKQIKAGLRILFKSLAQSF
jgi:hypothetical protein